MSSCPMSGGAGLDEDDQDQFRLEVDTMNSEGDILDTLKTNISSSELLGAEIIEIIPDDIGAMFVFKLKDNREIVFVQGIEGLDYYFVQVNEEKTSQDTPAVLQ
jgi:hypothetical protein